MTIMQKIIVWLETLAQQVPVTWFTFIGALAEEVIAPIPSPLVMTLAGSIAASQGSPVAFLLVLSLIGAFSKTIGSAIIYFIADKMEDVLIDKFGKFLGISHSDTEGLGKFFGKGKRDDIAIMLMRAIPIMPTAPVSVIAGLIKINFKTYIVSTFLGLLVRNMIYLYFGYTSLGALESLSEGFDSLEKIGYLILSIMGGVAILWMYRQREKGTGMVMVENLINSIKKKFRLK
jgi:membrane protein DedA with SNARE-associated domain